MNKISNAPRFLFVFTILFFISSRSFSQTTISGGVVSGVWTLNQSPYYVEASCTVNQFTVLTIEPGVEVFFEDSVKMLVYGSLIANGNSTDSIRFSIVDTLGFADTSTVNGGWGGIRFYNGCIESHIRLNYCVFTHAKTISLNDTLGNGGAVYIKDHDDVHISHSRFSHNIAWGMGGAIYYTIQTHLLIDSCLINHNISYEAGGGIANTGPSDSYITNCKMVNNSVINKNSVYSVNAGGGFYSSVFGLASSYTPILINNYICNNIASNGGGVYESTPGCHIVGNIICNNQVDGIFCGHSLSVSHYTNNTICNNGFDEMQFGYGGAGINTGSQFINVKNNIIWGNRANPNDTTQIDYILWGNPVMNGVKYNTIEYGFPGQGNTANDPYLKFPTSDAGVMYNALSADWSLEDSSTSINSGYYDTTGLFLKPYDIMGNPRWFGAYIERGAIENQTVIQSIMHHGASVLRMEVFPNPSNEILYLKLANYSQDDYYEIYNMSGKMIKKDRIYSNINQIYLGNLSAGVYQLVYYSRNLKKSIKIIKK